MKYGTFDMKELKRLQDRLQKMQSPEAFCEACAKELAARLLRKVIMRTPVGQYPAGSGKTGGTLRRGWTAGGNQDVSNYVNSVAITHTGDTYTIEITNPVEYAPYVEYGHRTRDHKGWVKGRFMMTISEKELQQIAPKVLMRRMLGYMEGLF